MPEVTRAVAGETPDRSNDKAFAGLKEAVEAAVAFAAQWPPEYRSKVFDVALARVLGTAGKEAALRFAGGVTPVGRAPAGAGLQGVARELGIDVGELNRAVEITDDGKVAVLGRIEGRTNAELQVAYSTVLCFVREKGLGQLNTPIEELRAICQDHGCYDKDNFTANFRKSNSIRELGSKGARSRSYRLTLTGIEEAKTLLKRMTQS